MKKENDYYKGKFSSLKHNILLMLLQIEENLQYSDFNPTEYLEHIQKRVNKIIKKIK